MKENGFLIVIFSPSILCRIMYCQDFASEEIEFDEDGLDEETLDKVSLNENESGSWKCV